MNKYEKDFREITGFEFNRYYLEYCPKLTWYLASRYTKDVDKAKDFANQAFMQALEKIETFDKDKSKLITWLTKIAINLVIKEWKDFHKYNFISLERDTAEAPSLINVLKNEDGIIEHTQDEENKKKVEIVQDIINVLPEKYKRVMIMRELDHMSYKDIAESIKKTTKINLKYDKINLSAPEDLFSLEIKNEGECGGNVRLKKGKQIFEKYIKPGENILISRDDIDFDRIGSNLEIDGSDTTLSGNYIVTTNLSTIKSQIKKGRELIQKKVHKKFEIITQNGVL